MLYSCSVLGSLYIQSIARFLELRGSLQGIVSQPEVKTVDRTAMLLFILLSNLTCLLLPALTYATAVDPVHLAARHVKRLSYPLKNLLHKRDAILFAGTKNVPGGLALNSTNGEVIETKPFEEQISIPREGSLVYFIVC